MVKIENEGLILITGTGGFMWFLNLFDLRGGLTLRHGSFYSSASSSSTITIPLLLLGRKFNQSYKGEK